MAKSLAKMNQEGSQKSNPKKSQMNKQNSFWLISQKCSQKRS